MLKLLILHLLLDLCFLCRRLLPVILIRSQAIYTVNRCERWKCGGVPRSHISCNQISLQTCMESHCESCK